MLKTLILICEGKGDKQALAQFNKKRHRTSALPLSDKGKRAAQRLGIWLMNHSLVPDEVVSSNSERAMTSSEKMLKAMDLGINRIRCNQILAKSSKSELKKIIEELPSTANTVALIGNKKQINQLMRILLDAPAEDMKASAIAVLRGPKKWPKSFVKNWQLQLSHSRKELPKGFPYPDINGTERRIRPAYYYRQSAVIPYRVKKNKTEVMLITSSKNNHWVFPKGIHEPGLSAQESAAKEAYEEAGIEGLVEDHLLGTYQLEKWQGQCKVLVYPMKVLRQISTARWQESYRQRQWVDLDEAKSRLANAQLDPIIDQLEDYLTQ